MKRLKYVALCLLLSASVFSQKAVIAYEKTIHDFGKINEADGKVTYEFKFTNKGNAPLVVNQVQASCGCTSPSYTKKPIEPGSSGTITVTYNPASRPGGFNKSITVYSNATEAQSLLQIKGEVIPKVVSNNPNMPIVMGDLRMKSKVVQFNQVYKMNTQTRVLDIQNAGKSKLRVSIQSPSPAFLISVSPQVLEPNEEGKITFSFNSAKYNLWGPFTEDVFVSLNGSAKYTDEYHLTFTGNVIEDFASLTAEQRRSAPVVETSSLNVDLGLLKPGTKKAVKFKLSNKGQNPLLVRRVVNYFPEISVQQPKHGIAKGKSADIIFTVNTKGLSSATYKKQITIQTNDPKNPYVILTLNWKL